MKKHKQWMLLSALLICAGCADKSDINADFCPEDPNKLAPGICGCGVPDDDTDGDTVPDCVDVCPNNKEKSNDAGACGCDADEKKDENGNHIPDCLENSVINLCPDDPDKWEPGVCGCGFVDDTEPDDGDGIPCCKDKKSGECSQDKCPGNKNKLEEGICGCDTDDTEENIADNDGDGVVNCLDECPDDASRVKKDDLGCGVPDSDWDGVRDEEDECPYNKDIQKLKEGENCIIENDGVLELYTAADLVAFGEIVQKSAVQPIEGAQCLNLDETVCAGDKAAFICLPHDDVTQILIWQKVACSECKLKNQEPEPVDPDIPPDPTPDEPVDEPDVYICTPEEPIPDDKPVVDCAYDSFKETCSGSTAALCINGAETTVKCAFGCSLASSDAKHVDCVRANNTEVVPKSYKVKLMRDIDLGDISQNNGLEGDSCRGNWQSIDLYNVEFDGNGKTITYKNCRSTGALFNEVVRSEVKNLKLQYDMGGSFFGTLANHVVASLIDGIQYKGDLFRENRVEGQYEKDTALKHVSGLMSQVLDSSVSNIVIDSSFDASAALDTFIGVAYAANSVFDKHDIHFNKVAGSTESIGAVSGTLISVNNMKWKGDTILTEQHALINNYKNSLNVHSLDAQYNILMSEATSLISSDGYTNEVMDINLNATLFPAGPLFAGSLNNTRLAHIKANVDKILGNELYGIATQVENSEISDVDISFGHVNTMVGIADSIQNSKISDVFLTSNNSSIDTDKRITGIANSVEKSLITGTISISCEKALSIFGVADTIRGIGNTSISNDILSNLQILFPKPITILHFFGIANSLEGSSISNISVYAPAVILTKTESDPWLAIVKEVSYSTIENVVSFANVMQDASVEQALLSAFVYNDYNIDGRTTMLHNVVSLSKLQNATDMRVIKNEIGQAKPIVNNVFALRHDEMCIKSDDDNKPKDYCAFDEGATIVFLDNSEYKTGISVGEAVDELNKSLNIEEDPEQPSLIPSLLPWEKKDITLMDASGKKETIKVPWIKFN